MSEQYQAPTVEKTFQILRLISERDQGARISDLSKKLKISKSTVHGIASALERLGAVIRDPSTKRYVLGITLFELGKSAFSRIDLKDTARPIMENLMEQAHESVFLGVRNGENVTIIDIVESRQDLKITAPIGTRIPLFAGAVGKVFMASIPEQEAKDLVRKMGLHRFTENTIIDFHEFFNAIRGARQNGFAIDDEEYIRGVRAVASAIKGEGQFTSAIWVVGFKPIMSGKKMADLAKETRRAAEMISRKINELSVTKRVK